MRALLLLGAIIVELFVGVMLIGGISYGITQSYSIGAAGYGRMGVIGMVLALLFLWIFAWFPSLLALGILLRLARYWRGESDTRIKKIGITFAAIFMMFATACTMQGIGGIPLWLLGADQCQAQLVDVIAWRWPCH